jgi:hypothetical protein
MKTKMKDDLEDIPMAHLWCRFHKSWRLWPLPWAWSFDCLED